MRLVRFQDLLVCTATHSNVQVYATVDIKKKKRIPIEPPDAGVEHFDCTTAGEEASSAIAGIRTVQVNDIIPSVQTQHHEYSTVDLSKKNRNKIPTPVEPEVNGVPDVSKHNVNLCEADTGKDSDGISALLPVKHNTVIIVDPLYKGQVVDGSFILHRVEPLYKGQLQVGGS